ncbi:hypothetical protein [Bradyrhizobium sp. UFLA05-112]|jgi:hypothetical protein
MDNRINEIRRKISALRSGMIDLETSVRDLVNRDRDCSESAVRLLGLRQDMKRLIADWKSAGGGDFVPNIGERVRLRAEVKNAGKPQRIAARC